MVSLIQKLNNMKKFAFLWSSLLLMVLIVGYCIAITRFVSEWFIILTIVCAFCSARLISLTFLEAQLLKRQEKYELVPKLHRLGYLFLLVTFGCILFIANDPAKPHVISLAMGIGCFFNYILSHLLRNMLGSWVADKCNFKMYENRINLRNVSIS